MNNHENNDCVDAALLEIAEDFRGRVISIEAADKIIKRILERVKAPNQSE